MDEAGNRKLNLGAGSKPLAGYVNLDRKRGEECYPLPEAIADESCDEIRASHLLEHFGHGIASAVVNHWVSKLKPGGVLKLAVPDFERIARAYMDGIPIDVQGYTMGGQVDEDDYHAAIWDREALIEVMLNAGLERIRPWTDDAGDCASLPISLNLQGTKPYLPYVMPLDHGIVAVLPTARFGPAIHHRCCYDALTALGIPVTVVASCFWHQHLSELMEAAIVKPETEYVLTLDFDSMFSRQDVLDLYRLMRATEADAICPLQMKRNCRDMLFATPEGKTCTTMDLQRNVLPIKSGHFGLTLFRADALRSLPRPWMVGAPNADGRWAEGKTDPDMEFWHKWADAGKSLYLAPRVRIGHLVELVVWPGPDAKPVYQGYNEYQTAGMPLEVAG